MSHEQSVVYYTGVRMTELSRDKKKTKEKETASKREADI